MAAALTPLAESSRNWTSKRYRASAAPLISSRASSTPLRLAAPFTSRHGPAAPSMTTPPLLWEQAASATARTTGARRFGSRDMGGMRSKTGHLETTDDAPLQQNISRETPHCRRQRVEF